jgi:hypothetical protein
VKYTLMKAKSACAGGDEQGAHQREDTGLGTEAGIHRDRALTGRLQPRQQYRRHGLGPLSLKHVPLRQLQADLNIVSEAAHEKRFKDTDNLSR